MKPVTATERVASIDTLRGVALAGVVLVNLLTCFRVPLSAHISGSNEPIGPGGWLLLTLLEQLIEFKAFTLFSLLFGVGVAIQAERAGKGRREHFLLRRFGALLVFGLLHMFLVWNGDILALYGVCGLLALPLLRLPNAFLAALGLVLIGAQTVATLPVPFPDSTALRALTAGALHAYGSGGWYEIFAFRWRESQLLIAPLLLLSLPRTLGLMLCGVAAWRRGLLQNNRRVWIWAAGLGGAIGIAGLVMRNEQVATIPLACGYAGAILLWNPHARAVAAAGRMALTNYLLQSVLFGFVFYSYGFGQFGRLEVWITLAGGIALYCIQLAWSQWWLERFYFGPFEWLWRSISYLQWQPFAREEARVFPRESARVLLVGTFVVLIPLVHLGVPALLAGVGPRWGWRGGWPMPANLLGTLPILSGAALLIWILATLLSAVRTMPPRVRLGLRPASLVQTGPYAWMRHPIYVAEGCLWVGMIVLLGSPVLAVIFALLAPAGLRWIVRREELALEEQFGEDYRAYRSRVPPWPAIRRAR